MRFSIVIQHFNRRHLLLNTIDSIKKSSLISDCEIIITDDASDDDHKIDDINILYPDLDIKLFTFTKEEKWWSCPVIPINKGLAESSGDIIILQGAECYHNGDIISDVDKRIKPNDYLVYSTFALSKSDAPGNQESCDHAEKCTNGDYDSFYVNNGRAWYQHSVYRNEGFNFCCAIYREDLIDLGGFDERYAHGVYYGDNDFILRVKRKGMNVISVDSPFIFHQYHDTIHHVIPEPRTIQICDDILFNSIEKYGVGYRARNSFLIDKDVKVPKYKNILLINPWEGEVFPPPSIGYLQACVKKIFKDSVKIISRDLQEAMELLKHESFDLVGVTFHSFSVKQAKTIRDLVKKNSFSHGWDRNNTEEATTHLICGGHHVSSLPQQLIDIGYDQVVIGVGENSIIDIILGKDKDKFVYDSKKYFSDIDDIPFPDYTGLSGEWQNSQSAYGYPIISSRGCPFTCNFCASSAFWKRKSYMRKPESVLSEIVHNIEKYGMNNWMFEDDNFTLSKNRAKEICKGIIEINKKYGKRSWQCASRAESLVDKELCSLLLEAGCETVWVGVESLSQPSLDRCAKHTTVEKMIKGVDTAESMGLRTMCQFIVGLPGDTIDDINETARKIRGTKMTRFGGNIAWILPSTDIYNKAKEFGFSDDVYINSGNIFYTYEQSMETLQEWVLIINGAKG